MKVKERIHYIDIAKGIAMILVILGHTKKLVSPTIVWWLYTFHMPLFFMLSGMVFNPDKYKTFKEMFKAKFKSLIIPYISFCLILWFWEYIVKRPTNFLNDKTFDKFLGIFLGERGGTYYLSMWFIPALFLSEILLYILNKVLKNKKIFFTISSMIPAVLGCIIIKNINRGVYWSADLVPTAISFMTVGYFLKTYREKIQFGKCKNAIIMIMMIAINIFVGYINYKNSGKADLYELNIGNSVYFYVSALSGAFAVILFCKLLNKCRILEYIGRNSLIYYAFHKTLFVNPLLVIVKTIAKQGGVFTSKLVQLLIVFSFTCIGLAIMSNIIEKCFPFMLGKFTINKEIFKCKKYKKLEEKIYEKV